MILYKTGDCCTMEELYRAFTSGFSDYVIQMEMSLEQFEARFFGPEGNQRELSHVAFKNEEPVGVLLGGIRQWDGLKSLRCGGLAISPSERGTGISQELMAKHLNDAKVNNCDRMTLEVLKGNDRAIAFYNKGGYSSVYDLKYYSLAFDKFSKETETEEALPYELEDIDWLRFIEHRSEKLDLHLPWQGEGEYFQFDESVTYQQIWKGKIPLGFVAYNAKGKLLWLWIRPGFRHQGIATWTLSTIAKRLPNVPQFSMALTNNGVFEGYIKRLGAVKADVEQFEMVRAL